jgi:hypothetical protein
MSIKYPFNGRVDVAVSIWTQSCKKPRERKIHVKVPTE